MAGTVILELRMHPFLDGTLEGGSWNFRPEWLEFEALAIEHDGYRCWYSQEEGAFGWPEGVLPDLAVEKQVAVRGCAKKTAP